MAEWAEVYRDSNKRIERRDTGTTTASGLPVWEERITWTNPNEDVLRKQAAAALDTNRTYLALTTPTAAQTTAQVKALTRQVQALIRFELGDLTGTD